MCLFKSIEGVVRKFEAGVGDNDAWLLTDLSILTVDDDEVVSTEDGVVVLVFKSRAMLFELLLIELRIMASLRGCRCSFDCPVDLFPVEFDDDWEDEEDMEDGGEDDEGGDGDDQLFWKLVGPDNEFVAEAWKLLRTLFNFGV